MMWQLLLLQVGFFLVLVWVLQRLFHGNLISAVSRVQSLQQQNSKKERELKLLEEKIKREYEENAKEMNHELARRRGLLEEEIKAYRETMLAKIDQEKQELLSAVLEKEKLLQRRFEQETKKQGQLIASRLVESAFSPQMKEVLHHELVSELAGAFSKIDTSKIRLQNGTVRLRTAYPLSAAEKEALHRRLVSSFGAHKTPLEIKEEPDPALVAGFIIYLGQTELDGSLVNRFRKSLENID